MLLGYKQPTRLIQITTPWDFIHFIKSSVNFTSPN